MLPLKYTGTVFQNIYTLQKVGSSNQYIPLDLYNQTISWDTTVPEPLSYITFGQLLDNRFFVRTYTVTFIIKGRQYYQDSSQPTTSIILSNNYGDFNYSYQAQSSQSYGYAEWDVNQTTEEIPYPFGINVSVWNQCSSGHAGCSNYPATGYIFTVILNITVTANCGGRNLENSFCSEYCTSNTSKCLYPILDYCFPQNTNGNDMPVSIKNGVCQNYVSQYIEQFGPLLKIDEGLQRYCTAPGKYKGFGDLFSSTTSQTDIDLCACHMPEEQYKAFQQRLNQLYSGFGDLIPDECLIPGCVSSPYKSLASGRTCPLPACLNIVNFNNGGTFENSCVDISQSGCSNIRPNVGGNICGGSEGEYALIIIAIILVIIILAIFITVIVIYTRKGNPKISEVLQNAK